jgi:hypothetical protein
MLRKWGVQCRVLAGGLIAKMIIKITEDVLWRVCVETGTVQQL